MNWFECKVKYTKEADNGLLKSVAASYLVDAMTFTECEARLTDELANVLKEFQLIAAKRSNISEAVFYGDSEAFHRCKITYATMDEDGQKEKKISQYLLVNADTVEAANDRLVEHLSPMQVPYKIESIKLDKISEILEYEPSK